jgi:hypothetical protein
MSGGWSTRRASADLSIFPVSRLAAWLEQDNPARFRLASSREEEPSSSSPGIHRALRCLFHDVCLPFTSYKKMQCNFFTTLRELYLLICYFPTVFS